MSDKYGSEAPTKQISDAIKWSKGRGQSKRISTTQGEYSAEAKRRFDENYDAIFRKPKDAEAPATETEAHHEHG